MSTTWSIVGCGPAGLSAGLSAIEHKLRYKLIEQEDSLGGAVFHYPRNKIAMTAPVKLALVGKVRFGEVQKEKLLEFWQGVVGKTGLKIALSRAHGGHRPQPATASSCAPAATATARAACCSRSAGAARRASSMCRARSRRRSCTA